MRIFKKIFKTSDRVRDEYANALNNLRTLDLLQNEIIRYMTEELNIDEYGVHRPKMGICGCLFRLWLEDKVTYSMAQYCKEYIQANRPENSLAGSFYWPEGDIEPRLKFIETHIKKLKRKVFIYKILKTILP